MSRNYPIVPLLLLLTGLIASCSTDNPDAAFGPHPAGWLYTHGAEANTNLTSCQSCHGLDFSGSGTIPSCFSCHSSGPPFTPGAPHAVGQNWLLPTGHVAAALANNPPCFDCHTQTDAGGGINPVCQDCHTAGDPLTTTGCTSCHNTPPDSLAPQGANQPNLIGRHGGHVGFTATTANCSACHNNGGTGSLSHFDRIIDQTTPNYPAEVTFLTLYTAKNGGAASYNATGQTCGNVSCHGGQTTPDWTSGNITLASDCTACHRLASVFDQYNSYSSGRHSTHAEAGGHAAGLGFTPTCSACHIAASLPASGHFDNLDTSVVEGDPVTTLLAGLSYNNTTDPANPTCTTNIAGCHPTINRVWGAAAAPHPVDGSYRAPTAHGPDAKLNQSNCQTCHGTPASGGPNPQFTVNIIQDKLGTAYPAKDTTASGCMKCHNDDTAHPAAPGRDNVRWYDAAPNNLNVTHNDAGGNNAATLNANCGLCHPGLAGGVGTIAPNCTFCHVTSPVGNAVGTCTSCHNTPPSGNSVPNRTGRHDVNDHELACNVCHTNNGPDGTAAAANHFTYPNPNFSRADLRPAPNTTPQSMTINPTINAPNVTCNGNCHGENHGNERWY